MAAQRHFEYPYNLTAKSSGGEIFRGMLIAFLIIFGLIKLPKGGLLLFLYLGATMAVLLVWPEQYGGLRYFIAAIPFFIFLFFYGINAVILYLGKRRRKNIPVFLPAACMIIFALIFMFPAYSQALVEKSSWRNTKPGVLKLPEMLLQNLQPPCNGAGKIFPIAHG